MAIVYPHNIMPLIFTAICIADTNESANISEYFILFLHVTIIIIIIIATSFTKYSCDKS